MTIGEAIRTAYSMATRISSLDTSDPKYQYFIDSANILLGSFINEPYVQWMHLYRNLSLGTIQSDRVTIDSTVREFDISQGSPIRIVTSTGTAAGQVTEWSLIRSVDLYNYRFDNACAIVGNELVFTHLFIPTDVQYGSTVYAPVFVNPDPFVITDLTTVIPIPDPMWLVYMLAAEYARTDKVISNQYGNFVAYAQNSMDKMKEMNDQSQLHYIPGVPTLLGGESFSGGYWGGHRNSAGQPLGD